MTTLPGVTIHSKVYESAASLVYRGIREQDNCAVIAKVLKQDYPSPQELTRYRQEYEITRSLNIEGVVQAYSQQDYQRTLVILLEDFGGESLEYWMRQQSDFCPMPLPTFLKLAIALTDTLGKIHAAQVIHKDINPGNIVFNPQTGVVKIIDFGIATRFNRTNPTFKSLHLLEGTPAYLSPEQTGRMNRMLDYRTDFYSLGVTFYELLTGQVPFLSPDILELVHCHIARSPIPPHELNATIPKPISDIVMKLMAKNAEDRYQSAWGIKGDLECCAQQLAEVGRIEPMPLGLQDVSEQFCIPQKLYGRDTEIEALLATFDRVAGSGGVREMMLVSGYAGIGKTALVQELYKPITAKRGYFIWGKFDQFGRNVPYSAIVDALKKLVLQLLGEPDEQVQQWRSRLLAALGSNGQIIIDVIPEVELIIGKQPSVPEVGATEAQNRFNLTFQRFVRAFCAKEHPLVIFLDDLQWIDTATLRLIELILLDEQTQSLFLIGAYRDHEVTPTHPLVLTLESLRNQGAVLEEIHLTPLTLESLSQLLAETLHRNPETVHSLAQTVARKTEGNPFFVGEFLKLLYDENLLIFDVQQLGWQWNLAEIEAQDITDNVVELLLRQLQKLPDATQQILCRAACVGAEFDLETLAIVLEKSPKAISQDLLAAIQAGLIQPLSNLDEDLLVQKYKFSHDRVQQAAYALIDEPQKQVVHLQIGRNLLEKTLPEQRFDRLFEIVDHLNQGIELITAQPERTEIARLSLMAGQKAKSATAYEAALQYFNIGLKLLNPESWHSEYNLTLALYSEAAEAAYLHGRFSQMEQFVEVVLTHAKTVVDTAQVYNSRIQRYSSQGNLEEVLRIGLKVLKLLGVSLLENPSELDVQRGLEEIAALLAEREIEDLINLPEMTAPESLAAMSILINIGSAAFMVSPALMILIVCKMVSLSVNYGNTTCWSPHTYVAYSLVLCGVAQDIELGYKFVKLALSLAERSDTQKGNAKALEVASAHVMHWKLHIKETIPFLVNAYQTGVETGDFEFAAYAAHNVCHSLFFAGEELTQLEQKTAVYSKAIRQIRREIPSNWIAMLWQTVLNLSDGSENPSRLIGRLCNEEQALPRAIAVKDGSGINYFSLYKIVLCYLFGEYYQAAQTVVSVRQQFEEIIVITIVPLFYFYNSLVLLSLWVEASSTEKAAWLSCVITNQEKMQKWAEHAPMNYLHKFYLVEAEKARVLGQFLEAEELYEQAIAGAAEHEYIQEEALAYELAAKHYLARGREKIAQTYMKEAHYCYDRWGAVAKVKDLETRYPQFFSQSSRVVSTSVSTTSGTIANTSHTALDLAAVMKASQAISREIELEQLLRSLMQILIENAGAQTGYLILEKSGEWLIEAACELDESEIVCTTQVLRSVPITNQLPESIVQYVIRTQEPVTLNDATREGAFTNEPYIQRNQTQSILCLPLLNQAKLVGVLYLENQLATGAFTPERSQILQLLSTQAAIAIENAKLYSQLRASKNELTQFFEAIPVGIVVADTTGRPCYSNRQATQLAGKTFDLALTMTQLATAHQLQLAGTDEPYPTERTPIVRALSGERARVDDIEIQRGDTTIPIEAWGTPVFDEQGNVAYAIATFQDITDRKQAEKLLADYNRTLEQQVVERTTALQASEAALRDVSDELRSREQELRLITDALPALVGYINTSQRYQFINRSYEVWFRRNRSEILGKAVDELLSETAYQIAAPNIEQALTGQLTTFEAKIPYPTGEKYISSTLVPDFDANGRVKGVVILVTDISDRKRTEEALLESEQLLSLFFAQSLDGFFIMMLDQPVQWDDSVDKDQVLDYIFEHQRVTQVNDAMLAQYRASREQFIGITPKDAFAHDLAYGKEVWRHLFDAGKLYIETDERRLDGTAMWVEGHYICLYDSQGRLIGQFGVQRDISDRKRAEEALRESEQLLDVSFSQSLDGFFIMMLDQPVQWDDSVDKDQVLDYVFAHQKVTKANDAILAQYGISQEQFIGFTPNDLYAHDLAYGKRVWREFFDAGKLYIETNERRLDGTAIWIEGNYICLYDSQGRIIGHFGVQRDVSDRKQAEAALRDKEQELRLITDALPVCICYVDINQRHRFVNHTYEVWFGCSREEILGKHCRELLGEAAYQIAEPYFNQALAGQMTTYEAEIPFPFGKKYISATFIPDFDANAQVRGYYGLIADISDRKQAEAALQASEAELQLLFAAIPDSLCVVTAEGQIIKKVDPDQLNQPIEARIGKTLHQVFEKEQADEFMGYIQQVLNTQRILTVEYSLWIAGRQTWFSARIAPIRHERVLWLSRDISDRKRAEIALQASEAELRALFSAIPDPLCVFTGEGQLIGAIEGNPSYGELHKDEYIGKTLHQIYNKEKADEFLSYIQQVTRTQQALAVEYRQWIAGREIWFSARIAPIRHEQVIWLARDITALKQAEAASILEERNRMAREIHDTLAQAFTGVLVHMGAISRLAKTNPEAIQSHIQTVRDLARTGLTEARRSVAALRPQLLEDGSLWTALEQFVSSLQSSTETRLICELVGAPYVLPIDTENNLLRIGQEAFTNAVKYAHANEIRLELVYEPTQCCLRIRDDGQGFEVNSTTLSRGFGLLGMSERAEHIGAQLSIDSQPGQGTEVSVSVQREATV